VKENRIHVSLFVVTTLLTIAVVGLLLNIIQRKQEARDRFAHVVPIADLETDPEVWGHNFPDQYDGWKRTAEATLLCSVSARASMPWAAAAATRSFALLAPSRKLNSECVCR